MLGAMRRSLHAASPYNLATLLLLWVFFIHGTSLYLFTRGFLLSRLALDNTSKCEDSTLPATHSKAILLIIDSLRFDFITPNPPHPPNENCHGVFTFPAELTAKYPDRSFIFNAYSDPPTATLQRIKGITTGSLPTFVDIGSNFGGSAIKEDSLIHQVVSSGKRAAFMGDDTWTVVYPDSFARNMTWPYDSFNVEDLHSVDEGVIRHLFPLLRSDPPQWDFIVGHFLGVDHVGHRVGPSGETMRVKLKQMDSVLREVVELMDDDTLLVVLGDHGMDSKGDHGGDGILETNSAMWIYSKSTPLATSLGGGQLALDALPTTTFPGCSAPHRSIQQIDLVPTLALLLGLPIPFNNLGMIIPELFQHPADKSATDVFPKAMQLNAEQIRRYLEAYRSSPSGGELDESWEALDQLYRSSPSGGSQLTPWERASVFIRETLRECRALWAQFNVILMCSGLMALALSVPTVWSIYRGFDHPGVKWDDMAAKVLARGVTGAIYGAVPSGLVKLAFPSTLSSFNLFEAVMLGIVLGSELYVLSPHLSTSLCAPPKVFTFRRTILPIIILILHSLSYSSNSFLMWEDRLTQLFLLTLLLVTIAASPVAVTSSLRLRVSLFTLGSAILLRFISTSTVCREEQQPYCHVTFYASSTTPVAPLLTTIGAPFCAYLLPKIVKVALARSKSDKGVASLFLDRVLGSVLMGSSVYWLLDRLESWEGLNPDRILLVQLIRIYLARFVLGGTILACGGLWWYSAPCVEIRREAPEEGSQKTRVVILGFANAYGSSYMLFLLVTFALVFAVTQPTGQVTLVLSLLALMGFLEVNDSEDESVGIREAVLSPQSSRTQSWATVKAVPQAPTFVIPAFLSILSFLVFYATGHQAVMSSIQWKTAFIGFPVLTYPFSPLLVALNTFGPIALPALAAPLFALWNVDPPTDFAAKPSQKDAPSETPTTQARVISNVLKISIGVSLYHSALTLGTAISAAILRRHLMVWKVFAPRFMLGGVALLVVDVTLVFGMGVGSM
ncbi:mannose-ethanolamine phosphotransferase gpi13 [Tulasnella sp. 403]|nr:mannose-ethanolamine phosphotransferase gpi13 [Tulasnella sp. 403]